MSALTTLVEERDRLSAELDSLVSRLEHSQEMSPEDEARSSELIASIDEVDRRIAEENDRARRAEQLAEARKRAGLVVRDSDSVRVENEPMVYGDDSQFSYWFDMTALALQGHPMQDDARQRMAKWSQQVGAHIRDKTKLGRSAAKQIRTAVRTKEAADRMINNMRAAVELGPEVEVRAMTTGQGSGGSFVTPAYFVSEYAPYREYGRAFADATNRQPLPDYGMVIYLPNVVSPAGVQPQGESTGNSTGGIPTETGEGTLVNETDPTAGYLAAGLQTMTGQVTVSQQVLDRAGPNFSFDKLIFDQLNRDYAPKVDTFVLNTVLATAGQNVWSGNNGVFELIASTLPGSGGFLGQVTKAKATIRTTEGTVLNPTHLFMVPQRWEFIAAWADSQGRPVVVPDYAGPWNAIAAGSQTGDEGVEGRTGYRFAGLPVFADANIPTPATGADQAIVADMAEVYFWEGALVPRVIPQTYAQNLQTLIQIYSYVACLVRYPKCVQSISGTGMSNITYVG